MYMYICLFLFIVVLIFCIQNIVTVSQPLFMLQEHHHNLLQYQIHSSSRVALSDIFACLEDYEDSTNIEDFSVSQTTLENVSLSIYSPLARNSCDFKQNIRTS